MPGGSPAGRPRTCCRCTGSGSSPAPGGTSSTRSRPGGSDRCYRDHPAELTPVLRDWAVATDRWLRRTSIICQLGAKERTDLALLTEAIEANVDDRDFFLRKGIGWALRQYARTDPAWVRTFVDAHPDLSALSRREALKHLTG